MASEVPPGLLMMADKKSRRLTWATDGYSQRKATMGSTLVARRAGM